MGIFILSLLIVIKEALAIAQHYLPNIIEVLEGIININIINVKLTTVKIMNTIILSTMKVYYNTTNKLVKTGKHTSKRIHNMDTIR